MTVVKWREDWTWGSLLHHFLRPGVHIKGLLAFVRAIHRLHFLGLFIVLALLRAVSHIRVHVATSSVCRMTRFGILLIIVILVPGLIFYLCFVCPLFNCLWLSLAKCIRSRNRYLRRMLFQIMSWWIKFHSFFSWAISLIWHFGISTTPFFWWNNCIFIHIGSKFSLCLNKFYLFMVKFFLDMCKSSCE